MAKTITVSGVGTANNKPDYIIISMNLSSKNMSYEGAVDSANRRIELLQNALSGIGFAKDDLKTQDFTVNSEFDNIQENGQYKRVFSGYSCTYYLKLSFDFSAEFLAKTLNAIINSKADTEFSISFTVKDPEKISEQLLISAAENARKKAEILCKALMKTLGELISIDYNLNGINAVSPSNYRVMRAAVPMAAVPEFTPEDIHSDTRVTFVWEIV
ncbi:MAG: SIMPL domain-containing protein [Oscillospiraceae bacterium]|nr:SIMPL domain-containing protein [Oscillospiraceae bacterium]